MFFNSMAKKLAEQYFFENSNMIFLLLQSITSQSLGVPLPLIHLSFVEALKILIKN